VPIQDIVPGPVDIQSARFGDVFIIEASGELDLHGVDPLQAQFDRIERLGGRTVIVDLLAVPFLDSAALGVLVGAAKRLLAARGHMFLVADDPRTLRVLQVTGLDRVFALERTLSAAIDAAIAVGKERST
jgi:anti-sigma B factor antagonist